MGIKDVFPKPLRGEFIRSKGQWELIALFEYRNPPVIVEVPVGFVSDGASIPSIAHPIVGPPWGGKYPEAAVIHDYLYCIQTTTRWEADKIFYQAMKVLGVPSWKRSLMHFAVRVAGWIPWGNYKKR